MKNIFLMNREISMSPMHFEIAEPQFEKLEPGKSYNLAGIRNSGVIKIPFTTGKMVQRFCLITPRQTQLILEIWNNGKKFEPSFNSNWKWLQFVFIKQARYHGICKMADKICHVFRLPAHDAQNSRFVWLSKDCPSFWDEPILPGTSEEPSAQEIVS